MSDNDILSVNPRFDNLINFCKTNFGLNEKESFYLADKIWRKVIPKKLRSPNGL